MSKEYWITNSRFKFIAILLVLIWIGFMIFFFMKAEEITNDPCSICAKRMGEEVICKAGLTYITEKTYYPNGSESLKLPETQYNLKFNITKD